jgi:hypothetical protein
MKRDQCRQACQCAAYHGEDRERSRAPTVLDRGCITVEDDGKVLRSRRMAPRQARIKAARGLRNMRSRARVVARSWN